MVLARGKTSTGSVLALGLSSVACKVVRRFVWSRHHPESRVVGGAVSPCARRVRSL